MTAEQKKKRDEYTRKLREYYLALQKSKRNDNNQAEKK
jgi:hypothetical protein